MSKLLFSTSHLDHLYRAWSSVRAQVRSSAWPQLLAELEQMEAAPIRALRRIQKQLRDGSYRFSPKWGYAKRKSGGSRRGITVQGIRDRVVQRAILNVVYTQDPALQTCLGTIPQLLQTPTSFAAAPGRGVPEAMALIQQTIGAGARAFAYSDMKDFFPCVPRHDVLAFLKGNLDDDAFLDLFGVALETEIQNSDDVRQWLALFPIFEMGVAQGSLLSSLVGNLALRTFDARLNRPPLTTVRYLDDFVILGSSIEAVQAGFLEAQQELSQLGMTCYAPGDGSHKAFLGSIDEGFDFLGCHVHPDGVSPARRARRKLMREIAVMLARAKAQLREFAATNARRRTEAAYAQTLVQIDRKVRGWGDAYRFVTNRLPFSQADAEIDRMLEDFDQWLRRTSRQADARIHRRIRGIALLSDTPSRKPHAGPPIENGIAADKAGPDQG